MDKVLIIAGAGNFPVISARAHKNLGREVSAAAFEGETSPELSKEVKDISWVKLGHLEMLIHAVASRRIPDIILAGKIEHRYIFTTQLDEAAKNFFSKLPDGRAENILRSLAEEFAAKVSALINMKVRVIPATAGLESYLAPQGKIGREEPTAEEMADVALGKKVASTLAALDCGQTVVVKKGVVVAIEGVEGTDETIRRAGLLSGRGFVVVKVARPAQDMRFDVPVIGDGTIETIALSGGRVLAVETGKTLMLPSDFDDKNSISSLADSKHIALIGI